MGTSSGNDRMFSGPFSTGDGSLMSFILTGSPFSNDWERYEGVPFPPNLRVSHMAGPGGMPDEALGEYESPALICYTFEMRNGVPECTDLQLSPGSGNNGGLRAKDLEYVKIDDVLEATLQHLVRWDRLLPSPPERRAAVGALMRRRRTVSEDVLLEVARVYEENVEHAPTQAVADYFGVSKSAADKRVKRARDAGYITKTARGGRKPVQGPGGAPAGN